MVVIASTAGYPAMLPWGDGNRLFDIFVGVVVGSVFTIAVLYLRLFGHDLYEALSEPYARDRRWSWIWGISFALIFGAIVLISLQARILEYLPEGKVSLSISQFIHYIDRHAGGFVGLVLAIFTIIGFSLTIQQLNDFQRRISNFPQLMDRLSVLAKQANSDDKLHIISYTPAIAALAHPLLWEIFRNALALADQGEPKVRILTQRQSTLASWHGKFIDRRIGRYKRKKIDQTSVNYANDQSSKIKDHLEANQDIVRPCYIETDYENLPGYYCFFTSRRAIIVAPLFLPVTPANSGPTDIEPPEMIGFETTDRGLIDDLFDQFRVVSEL